MTIKDFKGQVKIEDVQAAFDEIVDRINHIIDVYNESEDLGELDFTKGKPVLGPSGYTLTVGALKTLLNAYNGAVFGCRVFKVSQNTFVITEGLIILDTGFRRIMSQTLSGNENGKVIYDKSNDTVSIISKDTSLTDNQILITKLCPNRKSKFVSDRDSVQFENIPGYKLDSGDAVCDGYTAQTTDASQFVGNCAPGFNADAAGPYQGAVYFEGECITYYDCSNNYGNERAHSASGGAHYIYKPRGVTLNIIRDGNMKYNSQQCRQVYIDRGNGVNEEL